MQHILLPGAHMMVPNQQRTGSRLIHLLLLLLAWPAAVVVAQPTVLGTDVAAGTYTSYALTTVGGFKQVRIPATATVLTGVRKWEFAEGTTGIPSFTNNWRPYTGPLTLAGYNQFIAPVGGTASALYNSGSGGTGGFLPAVTSGRTYTFNITNNAGANNNMAVLETAYTPVSILSVSREPAAPASSVPVVLTTTFSTTPNAAEYMYVRYSIDNFATSSFVAFATTAAAVQTATIPAQALGGGQYVRYYVFSSSVSTVATFTNANVDMLTLNVNNAGGNNYRYDYSGTGAMSGTYFINNGATNYTVGGGGTNFNTFGEAFNALNAYGISGAVTFSVKRALTYNEGRLVLNAIQGATAVRTITFTPEVTAGVNPTITPTVAGIGSIDGIVNLNGADYVTFDQIGLQENTASITATTQYEYGYAFYPASPTDGAQNNEIKGAFIFLQKAGNPTSAAAIYGAPQYYGNTASGLATAPTLTNASGAHSFNKINGNTITALASPALAGAQTGVYLNGNPTAAFPGTGNEIGSTTGNTMTDIGGGSSNSVSGIRAEYQANLKIENNSITIPATTTGPNTVSGINPGSSSGANMSGAITINNNTITIASAVTGTVYGIRQAGSSAMTTVNITNNKVQNCNFTGPTNVVNYITDASTATGLTSNITGNQVINNTTVTTGTVVHIGRTGGVGTGNINGNFIGVTSTAVAAPNTMTGAFGTAYGIQAATSVLTVNNNQIANISFNNTSSTSAATLYGYYNVSSPTAETITNNTITGLSITGAGTSTTHTLQGIRLFTIAGDVQVVTGNTIGTLAISGSGSGSVTGIHFVSGGAAGSNIARNKIYDLSATGTAGFANGITVAGGGTYPINNNLIGDLRTPASTNLLAINGLNLTAGTAVNVYHNTINLAASSTGGTFGTSGIYLGVTTGTTLDLRGNLVVNTSTAVGTGGYTAALRRLSGTNGTSPANIATTSDYNLYNVGTASATNLLYVEGTTTATNAIQTLSAYKTLMGAPKEANAKTEAVTPATLFLFTTGTNANFLHINPTTATKAESGGVSPAVVSVDFDNQARGPYPLASQTNGGGAASDIGGDEGDFTPVASVDVGITALTAPASSQTCYTATETVTATLKNFAATTINFTTNPVTVSGTVTGPSGLTVLASVVVNTGTLAAGATQSVTSLTAVNMSATGTYTFSITASVAGDADATNDALPSTPAGTNTRTVAPLAAGTASASPATSCGPTTATLTLAGSNGNIQWQSSTDNVTFANISSATTNPYTTASLTQTTYFRAVVSCGASSLTSTTATTTVTNPTITATNTPVSRCGPGNVTLTATASSGSTAQYYTVATGGTAVASGPSAVVNVSGSTTYYVGARDNGVATNVAGLVNNSGYTFDTNPSTDYPLGFNTTNAGTLTTVDVYPTATGTLTLQLYSGTNPGGTKTLVSGSTRTFTITSGMLNIRQTLTVNYAVAAGNYNITNTGVGLQRTTSYTGGYPLTSGAISVVGSYNATGDTSYSGSTYSGFFNLTYTTTCEPTTRTPIAVNVGTAPALSPATTSQTVCAGSTTTVAFSGGTYNSLSVSPSTGTVVTGLSVDFTPTITTAYTVTASDPSGCQATATVTLTITPLTVGTASASPGSFCGVASGTPTLNVTGTTGATGGFVWQSSSNAGGPFTTLGGSANQASFVAPTITATTYYQVLATCSPATATSNLVTVVLANPSVTTTNSPQARCGTGTVTLTATPSAGATSFWYDTNVSTTVLATTNTYTPTVTATRQFFVAAGVANGSTEAVGRTAPASTTSTTASSYGLVFTAGSAFTLKSVDIYPAAGAGTVTIQVQDNTGTLISGLTGTYSYPAGTGVTPFTVALNYAVPAGTGLRLLATTSTTALVRESSGATFPYASPSGNVNITSGYIGGTSATYYFFYNWQVSGPCLSARTPVQVNVTTPPTLSYTGTPSYCAGGSTVLTFAPGSYTSLSILPATNATVSGSTITFTGASAGTTAYTVSANDGTGAAGCSTTLPVSITVNPVPNAPTLTPSSPAAYCAGGSTVVAASTNTNLVANQTLLTENFNVIPPSWTTTSSSTTSTGTAAVWALLTPPYTYAALLTAWNGANGTPLAFANSDAGGSSSTTNTQLISPSFSTYSAATLTFDHLFRYLSGTSTVDYSVSGGAWIPLVSYTSSQGVNPTSTTPGTAAASLVLPAGALNQANVQIRFNYVGGWDYYWGVDNVLVTGTKPESATFAVVGNPATASVAGGNITFNPTTTTSYNVTATFPSSPGCPSPATAITITVNPLPTFTNTSTNVTCNGNADGSITVTAAGGTAPYQFSKDNGGTYVAGTNPYTFTGLAPNTYQVLVKGVNCTAAAAQSVTITQPVVLTASGTGTNATCSNGSNGSVTVTATGGTAPYQFAINGGAYVSGTSPYTFTGLAPGSYTPGVKDANTCTATGTAVVVGSTNTAPTATLSNSGPVCAGSTATVNVALSGTGPYTFTYSDGTTPTTVTATSTNPYVITTPALSANTTYSLTSLSGGGGCSASALPASTTVTVNPLPTFSTTQTNVTCNGNGNGSITITAASGTAPYQYSLDNGTTYTASAPNPYTFTGLAPATYQVLVKGVNCTASAAQAVTITQPVAVAATLAGNGPFCGSGAAQLSGTLTGVAPFSLTYSTNGSGATVVSGLTSPYSIAVGTISATTAYALTNVTDANGCTAASFPAAVNVTVRPLPTFSTSQTNVTCNGAGNGSITITAAGGTAPYQYSLDNGTTYTASATNPYTFTGLAPATYQVLVKGQFCTAATAQAVTITQPVVLAALATPTDATCSNGTDGSIAASATGGTTAYQFNLNGGAYQASGSFTGLAPGTYTIGAKDANNCTATTTATVGFTNTAPTASLSNGGPVCAGSSSTVSVALTGTGPYTFTYTDGTTPTTVTNTNTNPYVITTPALTGNTTYSLTALSGGGGCAAPSLPASTTVTVNNLATWTGGANNSDWFDAGNWNNGCVPNQYISAIVPTGLAFYPNLTTGAAAANNLTIQGMGTVLVSNTAASLALKGNLVTAGPASLVATAGTMIFDGPTAQSIGAATFYNVTISGSGATAKTLAGDILVGNNFDLSNGMLTEGNFGLRLTGTTGTFIGASTTHFIVQGGTGLVRVDNVGTSGRASATFPIGAAVGSYTPATLTNTGTLDYFTASVATSIAGLTSHAVNRTWNISEGILGGSNAALTLQWNTSDELSLFNRSLSAIAHYTGGAWSAQCYTCFGAASGSNPWTMSRSGITSFSPFGVEDGSKPLPVSLTRFEATRKGADAELSWNTASEKNNAGFEVQVSTDGKAFHALHFVEPASANSTAPRSYGYTDVAKGKAGLRYYRLRQLDLDGSETFSPIRTVDFGQATEISLSAAPNPFGSQLALTLTLPTAADAAVLTLTDATGRTVRQQVLRLPAGTTQLELNQLEGLSSGLYLLNLTLGGQQQHLKVMKQ